MVTSGSGQHPTLATDTTLGARHVPVRVQNTACINMHVRETSLIHAAAPDYEWNVNGESYEYVYYS